METESKLILSKVLTQTHKTHRLDFPSSKLSEFPPIPEGKNYVKFKVTDNAGREWKNFRLAIRNVKPKSPDLKPIIDSTDWLEFIRTNHVVEGDTIHFYKEINRANGEVIGYKVRLDTPGAVRVMGAVLGRD